MPVAGRWVARMPCAVGIVGRVLPGYRIIGLLRYGNGRCGNRRRISPVAHRLSAAKARTSWWDVGLLVLVVRRVLVGVMTMLMGGRGGGRVVARAVPFAAGVE